MNDFTKSLDGAVYFKHFNTFNVSNSVLNLTSTIDLPLPKYKNGFKISVILDANYSFNKIKIDKLSEIKVVDYYGRDIIAAFNTDEVLTFVYDDLIMGTPRFVLNEARYEINSVNTELNAINTTIEVIQSSIETDVVINAPNHGLNVQPVYVDTNGTVAIANSTTEVFANGLLLPVDVNNYIVKTAGTFRVPASFMDEYNSGVTVNAYYFLKGTKMSITNPKSGKVQSLFKTHILKGVIYGTLLFNTPIIEYVTEF